MAKKFSELRAKMSPAAQARARARADQMLAEMPLQGLRRARKLSQETLAEALGIAQPQVSKIEGRTDLYVSTLRRYLEAMGGSLEIVANFPEGSVRIDLFGQISPGDDVASLIMSHPTSDHVMLENWLTAQPSTPLVMPEASLITHAPETVAPGSKAGVSKPVSDEECVAA